MLPVNCPLSNVLLRMKYSHQNVLKEIDNCNHAHQNALYAISVYYLIIASKNRNEECFDNCQTVFETCSRDVKLSETMCSQQLRNCRRPCQQELRGCERICVADYSNQCVSDCAFLQQSQLDECEFSYEQCKWPCAVGDGNCERFGISQLNSFTLSCILLISENVKSFAGHAKRMRVPAAIFVQKNVLKRFVVTPSFFSYTLFYSLFSILYCLFFILYLPHSPLSTPASPAAKTTVSHRWRMDSRCASSNAVGVSTAAPLPLLLPPSLPLLLPLLSSSPLSFSFFSFLLLLLLFFFSTITSMSVALQWRETRV